MESSVSNRSVSGLLCPRLQGLMAPVDQVVHVLEQLWPGHHVWCGVWRDEVWASALRVSTSLLAHVLACAGELVLQLSADGEILSNASFFSQGTLFFQANEGRGPLLPGLELAVAPFRQVVHVIEQLLPCHHAWSRIWCHEVWASALRIGSDLFAHGLAVARKLVLKLHAVLEVCCKTGTVLIGGKPGRHQRCCNEQSNH